MPVGDIVVTLAADSRKFTSGLNKGLSSIKNFAGRAEALLASLGAGFTLNEVVSAASEAQIEMRKLEAVLTATGGAAGVTVDEIARFADARQAVTDFGDEATKSAAAVLASFESIRGPAFFRTMETAQDLSVVMKTDLTSAVKMLGRALADPEKGMSKLARAGVTFNEAQIAQIKAFQESGDLMGAQGVILDALSAKFGGAAEAVSTPGERMKNAFGEMAEMLGNVFLPTVELLTQTTANVAIGFTSSADGAKSLGMAISDSIIPALEMIGSAGSVVVGVFRGLQSGVAGLTAKFAKLRSFGAQLDVWTGGGEEAQERLDFWTAMAEESEKSQAKLEAMSDQLLFGDGNSFNDAVAKAQEDLERRRTQQAATGLANIARQEIIDDDDGPAKAMPGGVTSKAIQDTPVDHSALRGSEETVRFLNQIATNTKALVDNGVKQFNAIVGVEKAIRGLVVVRP